MQFSLPATYAWAPVALEIGKDRELHFPFTVFVVYDTPLYDTECDKIGVTCSDPPKPPEGVQGGDRPWIINMEEYATVDKVCIDHNPNPNPNPSPNPNRNLNAVRFALRKSQPLGFRDRIYATGPNPNPNPNPNPVTLTVTLTTR